MINDLNEIILKTIVIICSLCVAWAFSYGVYLGSVPHVEKQSVNIAMQQLSNSIPEQIIETVSEQSSLAPSFATESLDAALEAAIIDRELTLTPIPKQELSTAPTPKPTLLPEPTTIPTKAPGATVPISDYEPLFNQWSSHFGVDINLLKHIARCESRFNPAAVSGIYGGMYQFSASTWKSTRSSMGHDADANLRFDANEAIKTAAFKIANGGQSAWKNCLPK